MVVVEVCLAVGRVRAVGAAPGGSKFVEPGKGLGGGGDVGRLGIAVKVASRSGSIQCVEI